MTRPTRRGCAAMACLLTGTALSASAAWADGPAASDDLAPFTVESDVHCFVIQKDGSVEERDDTIMRANTTSGVDDIAQRRILFVTLAARFVLDQVPFG